MDTIVRPPTATATPRPTASADLTAAIRLVAVGLARRITISPVHDARGLVEAARDEAGEQDVSLELISDGTGMSHDVIGILVTRTDEPG